jgi:hypothetical protein
MATAWGIAPLLKVALLTCAPKRHGQSLHQRAPRFLPYDTGAGSHMSCELIRSAKKANRHTRSM